jgi:hypothetical protein
MRPLAAVERFFERLFERPSARLFHAPLQPIQVQRRLERAMDAGRVDSGDRAYVPNRYSVTLNPADAEAFDGDHARIEDDLGEALHARARARGYRLIARPSVTLRVSRDVPRGDIQATAEVLDRRQLKRIDTADGRTLGGPGTGPFAPPVHPGAAPGLHVAPVVPAHVVVVNGSKPGLALAAVGRLPSEDRAMPLQPGRGRTPIAASADEAFARLSTEPATAATPPTGAYVRVSASGSSAGAAPSTPDQPKRPIATLELRTGGRLVATRTFEGGTLRLGRGRDNELVLADDRVSRHHGQVTARRGVLVYSSS